MNDEERSKLGTRQRRRVLGDAHVDRAVSRTNAFTAEFQDLITRYAWGEIWTRPGLDERTRRLLVLATMIALGRDAEFEMHLKAALEHGVSQGEIKEVLLQSAVYCGVPAANTAFHLAEQVFEAMGQATETPR